MDSERFDALTRTVASRRAALAGLVSGVTALLGLGGVEDAAAHNPIPGCRKIKDPEQREACLRRAKRHIKLKHSCKPQPVAVTCANRCGVTRNNCKKAVSCTCPAGKLCLGNSSCSRLCFVPGLPGDCPPGCGCGVSAIEGGNHCIPSTISQCEQVPLTCVNSAGCPHGHFCAPTGCPGFSGRCVPVCPI